MKKTSVIYIFFCGDSSVPVFSVRFQFVRDSNYNSLQV